MGVVPHLIVFGASLTATVTGYGFVLLASPLLLLLLAPAAAVPLSISLGWVVITLLLLRPKVWRAAERRYVLRLAAAGVLGIPVGTSLLLSLNAQVLRVLLGVVITALAAISLARTLPTSGQWPMLALASIGGGRQGGRGRMAAVRFRAPPWLGVLSAGFCGGILSGSAGLGGSLLVLYLSQLGLDKHRLRATSAATIWCTSSVTLAIFIGSGRFPTTLGWAAVGLVPALLTGMVAGNLLFGVLPDRRFRQLSLAFAAAAGVITAWAGLAAR